jgi:hypothetical protein
MLLTVINYHHKKKKLNAQHGYYMSCGLEIIIIILNILENENYYNEKYDKKIISTFLGLDMPLNIINCLMQNIKPLEDLIENNKVTKTYEKTIEYLNNNLKKIFQKENISGETTIKKTDMITYKFINREKVENKLKKMKKIDDTILLEYIDKKYGSLVKCAFVIGWFLGLGDDVHIPLLETISTSMGMIIKISNDFDNLERDILYSNNFSLNIIVNMGIHKSFKIFMENKIIVIENCIKLNIYTNTIKEIIENIEDKIDLTLKNTDLDLTSMYSSFTVNT